MENENSSSLTGLIKNLASTFFKLVSDMTRLAKMEAELAGKSLVNIIILTFLLGSLLTSTWLCISALIAFALVSLQLGWLVSLAIVTLLNILLMVAIVVVIVSKKKNLSFPATRRQLQRTKSI